MNLHEYQSKQLLLKNNILTPIGYVGKSYEELKNAAKQLGLGPWIVKCQIHAGGRSSGGGVKIVNNINDIKLFSEKWFGKRLITYQTDNFGQYVNYILIEPMVNFIEEMYVSIVLDRTTSHIIFISSKKGGVDIEKTAQSKPDEIYTVKIDVLIGPMPYQARELAFKLQLKEQQIKFFVDIFMKLVIFFIKYDLTLIEINPMVFTSDNTLICLDAKIDIDNNALYRQQIFKNMYDPLQEDPQEVKAAKYDLSYVRLDGNIGCMVNGAGLAMATMDIIKLYGGKPANFLDVSGSVNKEKVKIALEIILSDINVKTILINIFGGIVRCDIISDGIIAAIQEIKMNGFPLIIRFEGNNSELGINALSKLSKNSNFKIYTTNNLIDAVKKSIQIATSEV
uniref:Succinate--CoA ligase [ADP-forming] subunit beta n=1 Tax=Candidatus Aschnera chinzeii TaxID=1485666 RepID=A0AAT9G3Y4_9ENTR|nr:MAG: ADP-forming succinate--CoA ligase subunit beta [Candidatus Aschnera chinzeii]